MTAFVRQHKGAVLLSVALHIAVVAALTVGFRLPARARAAVPTQLAIEAIVVDQSVLDKEIERRSRVEREAVQRRQREERQAREAAEQAKRQEQQRQEQVRLDRERVEREAREKEAAEKREQERLAEERREREQQEQREREEAARREKEAQVARQQRQAEDELQRALAAEDERRAAEAAGLMDQYIRLIQDKIERSWIPPVTARAGLECTVAVVQIPGGDVIDARVTSCNGDEAVIRSIEAAVRRASPLPKPPDPSLFERNLNVIFRPDL
jgi:colicin import membrane protein